MAKYAYSFNNERYYGEFDTIEEALGEAKGDNYGCEDVYKVYIGEVVHDYYPRIDTDHLLEELNYDAYDKCGEWAEDYLEDVTKEDFIELDDKLNAVFYEWLKTKGYEPGFFSIPHYEVYRYENGKFALEGTFEND